MPAGSFSFPNVPPSAELEYEVELVDFDAADEVSNSASALPWLSALYQQQHPQAALLLLTVVQMKDRGEMTYEERLEAAERHRLKGNALFQQVRIPCTLLTAFLAH